MPKPVKDEFVAHIEKDIGGCWIWQRWFTSNGYGRFKGRRAHRVSFEMCKGPLSPSDVVRHTCDNRKCVNPDHLVVGSQKQNMQDAVERNRIASGARNGRTRVSEADVEYIRNNPDGLSLSQTAEKFGIGVTTASYIRRGLRQGGGRYRD